MIKNVKAYHPKSREALMCKVERSRGFTLVEMLLYMGLLSIFLVVLTNIFTGIMDVKLGSEATSGVDEDARYILARLAYDIRRADAISIPNAFGDTNPTLVYTIGGVPHTIVLQGQTLQLTNGSGTNALSSSASTIQSITFQKIGNPGGKETVVIAVTMQGSTQKAGGVETRTFQTAIGRRN